jgi:hypothetical protein
LSALTADAWTLPCPWLRLADHLPLLRLLLPPPESPSQAGRCRPEGDQKAELKTYLKRVRQRIAKNPDSPAWGQLGARWLAVVEHAKSIVAGFRSGKPGIRYVRKAAEEVLKVAEAATPRDLIETVLAIRGRAGS